MYRFDDFVVDPESWRLSRDGREIHVEPVVLKLLIHLISNRDRLVTREELMDAVWGDTVISESALTKAVARLRKALGDDSATHLYLETVRSLGYRFIATVEEIERPAAADSPSRQSRGRNLGRNLLLGVAVVTLTILAVFLNSQLRQEPVVRSLAVLPLSNLTGDPQQESFVVGVQEILTTRLSQVPGLTVISRQSTKRYRDSELSMTDIASELGVDALVEGSLLRRDDVIELTIQLIHGETDEHLWAELYTHEVSYTSDLIGDVAIAIGSEVLGTALPARRQAGPTDPRALEAFAQGLMYRDRFTRDGISFAIEQFEKAVEIEPGFALAWGELAVSHAMHALFGFAEPGESLQKWRTAASQAIEADDQEPIGHSGLGWARMYAGDFDGACESFAHSLRLNPSAPYAMHGDADCLMLDGHMDESVARLREIQLVSPFSAIHNLPICSHLFMARRFDEAIAAAQQQQARNRQLSLHWFIGMVYWQQGRFDKALAEERLELERRGDIVLLAALEEGFDAAGATGAMRAMAEALVDRADEAYVNPFFIGEAFARAEMIDEALHWLDQAAGHGSYNMTYLAYWPPFDVLRDDPRFDDLLERVYGDRAEDVRRFGLRNRSGD